MGRVLSVLNQRIGLFFALQPLRCRPSGAPRSELRELRAWHNRVVLREWPPLARGLILAAGAVVWPFWSAWLAWRENRTWGTRVRLLSGLGRVRQFFAMWGCAQTQRLQPADYYHLNLWQGTVPPSDYITDDQTRFVFRALNRGVDLSPLDDKQAFWELCRSRGLATPPILLSFAAGECSRPAAGESLHRNLFFKRRLGLRGRGAARWLFDEGSGLYTNAATGKRLTGPELIEGYRKISLRRPYIAQPCLSDHPAIADIGNGTLSVVRIMTVVRPDGTIGEFASLFKTPMRETFLTNLVDGALFSPVDTARGVLREAFADELGKPLHTCHPVSGVRVAGRALADWREAVALACAAHAALPQVAVIGWDMALTGEGPRLLEGNHGMSVAPFNFPPNVPLGRTELPGLLVWHLQRRLASAAPR